MALASAQTSAREQTEATAVRFIVVSSQYTVVDAQWWWLVGFAFAVAVAVTVAFAFAFHICIG